jgi:D-alanine-D-alanine ligase
MDKTLTKRLLRDAGLPTPRFVAFTATRWERERTACTAACAALALPWFVKPSRMGSSVGISKVKTEAALGAAVAAALEYDDLVLVEEGIPAREIEVAVLEADPPVASVPGEVVPGHEFYDYADKYLDDDCRLLAPAPLEPTQADEVRRLAVAAFAACSCEGMARVDFLLDRRDGTFYVNELNAIPGFTSISMYPRLLALSGVAYPRLLETLIETAMARHHRRRRLAAAALRPLAERVARGK